MNIEEQLNYYLAGNTSIAALVADRIYPLVAPQEAALPYLVYQRISTVRERSHSGPSGLAHPRFQITAAAEEYSTLRDLANAVRGALDGSALAQAVFVDNEWDGWDEAADAFVSRIDVIIWHEE